MTKLFILFSFSGALVVPFVHAENSLSHEELNEINSRLERFYQAPKDASLMSKRIPKYDVRTGAEKNTKTLLKLKNENGASPLEKLAGIKSTAAFRKHYCETFLKKQFPSLRCDQEEKNWSIVKPNDRVEDLTDSWVSQVTYDLDSIPVTGKSNAPNWSDDYWRTRWGVTSFRYADFGSGFKSYKEAVNSYSQPAQWNVLLPLQPHEISNRVVRYSPSEKYDLLVGDESFTLTRQQKAVGQEHLGPNGDVEDWMGICHGWAPAAILIDRPIQAATLTGARGVPVEWYPADVKALMSLAFANGSYDNNFIGGRCDSKSPSLYPNGRIADQDCFDNNPATFHLSLGNLIGRVGGGFVMDKTFDYEVWNQPVVSYEFTYFNPNNPSMRDKDWKKVAVPYDSTFKARDRFQSPLTRGSGTDMNIRQIVGVIATVVYVSETSPPKHQPNPEGDVFERETYTYDLELELRNGQLIPTGGEWHQNSHPDFLWTPRRGTFVSTSYDNVDLNYTGIPSQLTVNMARQASPEGYPLCQVMRELVRKTTGNESYACSR